MTRDEAYDQMREAATRLKMAVRWIETHGDEPPRWQGIINDALDDWTEARDALRERRTAT